MSDPTTRTEKKESLQGSTLLTVSTFIPIPGTPAPTAVSTPVTTAVTLSKALQVQIFQHPYPNLRNTRHIACK